LTASSQIKEVLSKNLPVDAERDSDFATVQKRTDIVVENDFNSGGASRYGTRRFCI
jgi:hypothetical protein